MVITHIVWDRPVSKHAWWLDYLGNLATIFGCVWSGTRDKKWKLSWWNYCHLQYESVYWRWEGWASCLNQWHLFLLTIKLPGITERLSGRKSVLSRFILKFRDGNIRNLSRSGTGCDDYRGRRVKSTQWSNWHRLKLYSGRQKAAI